MSEEREEYDTAVPIGYWHCPDCNSILHNSIQTHTCYPGMDRLFIEDTEKTALRSRLEAAQAELTATRALLAETQAERDELRALVEEVEWEWSEYPICPWCFGWNEDGHAPDCPRQRALRIDASGVGE